MTSNEREKKLEEIARLALDSLGACNDIINVLTHIIIKNNVEIVDDLSCLFDQNDKNLKKIMELTGENI